MRLSLVDTSPDDDHAAEFFQGGVDSTSIAWVGAQRARLASRRNVSWSKPYGLREVYL
jgi:hypothetical protein